MSSKERLIREEQQRYSTLKKEAVLFDERLSKDIEERKKACDRGSFEDAYASDIHAELGHTNKRKHRWDAEKSWLINPYFARMDIVDDSDEVLNCYLCEQPAPIEVKAVESDLNMHFIPFEKSELGEALWGAYTKKNAIPFDCGEYHYCYRDQRTIKFESGQIVDVVQRYCLDKVKYADITDVFLQTILSESAYSEELHSIIASVQEQQYRIINSPIGENFIVWGCAGSGKSQILFHRLYYYRRIFLQRDWKEVLILTPNRLFQNHANELISKFGLSSIAQYSLFDFYVKLLHRIDGAYVSSRFVFRGSEHLLPENYLEQVYSVEYRAQIQTEILAFFQDYMKKAASLLNIPEEAYIMLDNSSIVNFLANRLKHILSKLDNNSQYLSLEADCEKIRKQLKINKKRIERQMQKIEKKAAKRSKNGASAENDARLENLKRQEYDAMQNLETKALQRTALLGTYGLSEKFHYSSAKRMVKGLKVFDRVIFNTVVSPIIARVRDENGIPYYEGEKEKTKRILYKSDMYYYLMCCDVLGKLNTPTYKLICIDEAQDLHAFDYEFLRKIFKNSNFNIYGDLAQVIQPASGLSSWMIPSLSDCRTYILRENYRNTKEIVDFCNSMFSYDSIGFWSIGEAPQIVKSFSDKLVLDWIESKQRRTIIVEGYDTYMELITHFPESVSFNYIADDSCEEIPTAVNVYSVWSAKGLEFPSVFVYAAKMNTNQKYVACTRGRKELLYLE